MSNQAGCSRFSRAYFSLDALLALSISIFAFFAAAGLLAVSAASAQQGAEENSHSLAALRLSDAVLEKASAHPGAGYFSANEITVQGMQSIGLPSLAQSAGCSYARTIVGRGEEILFSDSFGSANGEVFCAHRLALFEGKVSFLEACFSWQ